MKEIRISFNEVYTLHGSNIHHRLMILAKEKGFPVNDSLLEPTPDMEVISRWCAFTDDKINNLVIQWEEKK